MSLPIRTRLTAVYSTVFCVSTLLLASGAYFGLRRAIESLVDRELQSRTKGVVDFLDDHIARLTPERFQKELRSHAALQPDLLAVRVSSSKEFVWRAARMEQPANDAALRVMHSQARVKGEQYDLDVAADLSMPYEILRSFRWFTLLSSPLVLAGAALLGYWISGRALRPVSQMTAAAQAIGASNLSDRIVVPPAGDELRQLAETLNGMLARIEGAFRHVTQFTANASHELRTPLAVIRTTAEVALLRARPSVESYGEALLRVLEESEKNTVLLDDMLRLARADSGVGQLHLKPLDLTAHLREVCDQLTPLAEEKGLSLGFLWALCASMAPSSAFAPMPITYAGCG